MKISSLFRHFILITRHRHAVFCACLRCGIPFRGLLHDLSKYSPCEFFESAKYYQGNRSPIVFARKENGVSRAWLHHKGRNPHHIEYWLDDDCEMTPLMPYKYAVECACDKISATKVYNGKNYDVSMPLSHFLRYGNKVNGNPKTMAFLLQVFTDLKEQGEKAVLNPAYMKKTYADICLR